MLSVLRLPVNKRLKKYTSSKDAVDDIEQLELWLEEAVKEAITSSQKIAAEKMQPMMGALGDLGL